MEFMCVLRRKTETFSESEFAEHLDEEAESVRRLYADGVVRSAWSRGDVAGGVLLVEADSEAAALAIVQNLPLGRRGMLEGRIIPLRGYRGFGPKSG